MTQQMSTAEVLNKAADLIEERGWRQGEGWIVSEADVDAPLCMEGAIAAAAGISLVDPNIPGALGSGYDRFRDCPLYALVQSYLDFNKSIFIWNDRSHRTASEVIEALRACAVIAASRETTTHETAGLPGVEVGA